MIDLRTLRIRVAPALIAGLVGMTFSTAALAQASKYNPCDNPQASTDFDGDQLDDEVECVLGLVGPELGGADAFTVPVCTGSEDLHADCLDAKVKNAFLRVMPAADTALPELGIDPEADLAQVAENGLGIRVGLVPDMLDPTGTVVRNDAVCLEKTRCLTRPPSGRTRNPRWIELNEITSLGVLCPVDASGAIQIPTNIVYGSTAVGNHVEFGNADFRPRVVMDHIDCVFARAGDTADSSAFKKQCVVWTALHEGLGHAFVQAPDADAAYENHYAPGDGCTLDQRPTYTVSNKGVVTFDCPVNYCRPTKSSVADGVSGNRNTNCGDGTFFDGDVTEPCAPVQ